MTNGFVCCGEIERFVEDPKVPLMYSPRFRSWSLQLIRIPPGKQVAWRDTSVVLQNILFCPACGAELPSSLRLRYLADMEELGIESPLLDLTQVPEAYRSDRWWREAGL